MCFITSVEIKKDPFVVSTESVGQANYRDKTCLFINAKVSGKYRFKIVRKDSWPYILQVKRTRVFKQSVYVFRLIIKHGNSVKCYSLVYD